MSNFPRRFWRDRLREPRRELGSVGGNIGCTFVVGMGGELHQVVTDTSGRSNIAAKNAI